MFVIEKASTNDKHSNKLMDKNFSWFIMFALIFFLLISMSVVIHSVSIIINTLILSVKNNEDLQVKDSEGFKRLVVV